MVNRYLSERSVPAEGWSARAQRSRARFGASLALVAAALFACSSSDKGTSSTTSDQLSLTSIAPRQVSARGGTTLTLQGTDLTSSSKVEIGDAGVEDFKRVSSTECTFKTPPLYAGTADINVSTASGSAKLANALDVLKLSLSFVQSPAYATPSTPPDGGPPDGGLADGGAPYTGTVTGAALADFDGDGHPDFVTCAADSACLYFANDGNGNFADQPGHFPATTPDSRALLAADFNGDGNLDLFLGVGVGGPGVVYQNQGHGMFVEAGPDAIPADMDSFAAAASGDFNGDGFPDLVVGNSSASGTPVRLYLNAGSSSSIQLTASADTAVPAADWVISAMVVADFDGDGSPDVLVATTDKADGIALRFLHNEAGELHETDAALPTQLPGTIRALAAGDVDGDGAPDLVVSGDGQDRLFLNDGTGHFFDATVSSMPVDDSPGTSIALVDLDRDRHPDLLIGNNGAQNRLYLNDGHGHFLDDTPLLPLVSEPTIWVGIADVNGDSANDLLVINASPTPANLFLSVEPLSP